MRKPLSILSFIQQLLPAKPVRKIPAGKRILLYLSAFFILINSTQAIAQLGTYNFNTLLLGSCPNNNNNINAQPANASFSPFTSVGTLCVASSTNFNNSNWNTATTILLSEYNEFTFSPNAGYFLDLTSLSFSQATDKSADGWILRSSIDGFTSDLATGTVTGIEQNPIVTLPAAGFKNIGAVTFRLYLLRSSTTNTLWYNENVSLFGTVVKIPDNPPNPISNSPQCSNPGVTLTAVGSAPSGETWYWQTSPAGTNTSNSGITYTATTTGT